MKFAHLADVHIGNWRDQKLRDLSLRAFEKAVNYCIENNVDFILISGDLFNTSLPAIDRLKSVVIKLRKLKEKNIPVYIIAGSHDFSPSGKTILDVLEEAQLLINVVKGKVIDNKLYLNFIIDPKTNAKITGIMGKKGMLERRYYENLDLESLENEQGFKIFMFHTALSELKPKQLEKMKSYPVSFLPKNFDYYAGGHVHIIRKENLQGYNNVIYPGPLFPNNFREVEDLQTGGFYIYENGNITYEPIQVVNVHSIKIDCTNKTPEKVEEEIDNEISNKEFNNTIITIRLTGILDGKISDIDFKEVFTKLYNKSAYFVMKSTYLLQQKEFEEIKIEKASTEEIEDKLINEHIGQIKMFDLEKEKELTKKLIESLSIEKEEGERNIDFEKRIKDNLVNVLELEKL